MGNGSKLEWSRMLGFEQITDRREAAGHAATVGAKVGGKIGSKEGLKG